MWQQCSMEMRRKNFYFPIITTLICSFLEGTLKRSFKKFTEPLTKFFSEFSPFPFGMEPLKVIVNMHLVQDMFKIISGFIYGVGVHAFVGCHHDTFIFGQPLDLLLHVASLEGALIVAPWESVVLDSLLTVFPPAITIVEYVHLAPRLERIPRFPRLLLLRRWWRPLLLVASGFVLVVSGHVRVRVDELTFNLRWRARLVTMIHHFRPSMERVSIFVSIMCKRKARWCCWGRWRRRWREQDVIAIHGSLTSFVLWWSN